MSRLARAQGGGDAFRDLNNALHELHALASWPSLDEICAYLKLEDARRKREGLDHARLVGISRVNVSRLFSAARLPKPDLLLAVVEYLAKRAYRLDVDRVCDRFDQSWRRALSEEVPPAPGPDGDDDWPDAGPNPARPRPRGPRPSGVPATDADPGDGQPFSLLRIVDELRPLDPNSARRRDSSAQMLMVNLAHGRERSPAQLTDRVLRGWSEVLSMGMTTVAEQLTAADMRRLIAETLDQSVETAVLWLRAPVIWDSRTGEAHFVTRDSELDAHGTLWNTVPYTEIQYAVAKSTAKAVFVVVIAGRSRRIIDMCGAQTVIPIGRTQWADTLYAHDDPLAPSIGPRPVFLLWLSEVHGQFDYSDALLEEMRSGALPDSDFTTGALFGRLRAMAVRLGQPEPYGVARHGGEAIVIRTAASTAATDAAAQSRVAIRGSSDRADNSGPDMNLRQLGEAATHVWPASVDEPALESAQRGRAAPAFVGEAVSTDHAATAWLGMLRHIVFTKAQSLAWRPNDSAVLDLLRLIIEAFPQPTDRHGGAWKSTVWAAGLQGSDQRLIEAVHRLSQRLPAADVGQPQKITRADVFATTDPFDRFVATMAWGFGPAGYGWWRTRDIVSRAGVGDVVALVEALQDAGANSPESTWSVLFDTHRLDRLGLSFATKVGYFAGYDRDREVGPLIIDRRTAWATWALVDVWEYRDAGTYAQYVRRCEQWARTLGCRSDDVERALFVIGPHVRQFYREARQR